MSKNRKPKQKRNRRSGKLNFNAEQSFLRNFNALPDSMKEQVMNDLRQGKVNVNGFNVLKFNEDLVEGLNLIIRHHPIVEILERLHERGELVVPEDILGLGTQYDKEVINYVTMASKLTQMVHEIKTQVDLEREQNPGLRSSTVNVRLMNLMYQNPESELIPHVLTTLTDMQNNLHTPMVEYCGQYSKLVDAEFVKISEELDIKQIHQLSQTIHQNRLAKYIA